jgi:glycosyltransferase involved in cell wall biosynthesis
MIGSPRVVLGMPAYNRPDTLARTLESLLSQTFGDFAIVIVDDRPSPETAAIAETYAARDGRVSYEANTSRLGMVQNWRRVFARARERFPDSRYFAWVSDHDLWDARWLQEMVTVLDRDPHVVLAYPENMRMMPGDARQTQKRFQTTGITERAARLHQSARYMLAGDMIYGLMRVDALERAGVFRAVVTPDRQVLLALSLFGQVSQVQETLWYREVLRVFDLKRQREVFFPGGTPLYVYLPSHVQHCATMVWDFAIRGRGRPAFGRLAGLRYAAIQLRVSIVRELMMPKADWRIKMGRTAIGRRLVALLPTAVPAVDSAVAPRPPA